MEDILKYNVWLKGYESTSARTMLSIELGLDIKEYFSGAGGQFMPL
jgi:hypothetical protein